MTAQTLLERPIVVPPPCLPKARGVFGRFDCIGPLCIPNDHALDGLRLTPAEWARIFTETDRPL